MAHAPGRRKRWRIAPTGRIRLVGVSFLAILGIVLWNLVAIQGVDQQQAAAKALEGRLVEVTLPAHRGAIQAADGTLLADNAARFRLVVDQQNVAEYSDDEGELLGAWGASQELAGVLDTEPGLLHPKLDGDRRWNVVATGLTSEVRDEIKELEIPGLTFEKYAIRSYPSGAVGGNLVGFVGSDGQPLAGLEYSYDDILAGEDGKQQYERGLLGERIPLGDTSHTPAVDGTGIRLTIDPTIQHYAQEAAAQAAEEHEAEWASVVMMDVQTGKILAASEAPSVDPNAPGSVDAEDRGSRIFTAGFEPGSTAKMITVAGLLEEGLLTPTDEFVVPDEWTAPNDEEFRDSSSHPDQKLTLAGILAQSSNTGTILAGNELSTDQRYDYLSRFGFGETSDIGFPGETGGVLHPADEWDGRTKYTVMFGQGMTANAVQTTAAFAAIANGGVLPDSQLVDGTVDPSGRFTPAEVGKGTRVVSEDTSAQVLDMLEHVVVSGTAGNADVPGYRVGGKTGTAQAPAAEGGGYDGYTASFVGVAPVDNPRIAVSVTLQRPREGYYGGQSAAPVFSDVTGFALRHLRVPLSTGEPSDTPMEWK